MDKFFQTRLARHQKRMMRYMRYVLNDHFVLICFILLGGLGLYYSELLKSLPDNFYWGGLLTAVIWWLVLQLGSLVTLAEPADIVFLLPKEKQMRRYLQKGFLYSLLLPVVVTGLAAGILMPMLVVSVNRSFGTFIWYAISLWLLKIGYLSVVRYQLYQHRHEKNVTWKMIWHISTFISLLLGIFVSPVIGLLIAAAQAVISYYCLWLQMTDQLDWEKMVAVEQGRLHRLYQFINLFTDVPEITAKVKRRKYLDSLLNRIPKVHGQTYLYLYARRMMRGTEFSGLYMRLVIIGGLCIGFLNEFYFSLVIGALFLYLIGFQLIPLYNQFHYMVLTQLYPIPDTQKQQALQQLVGGLLLTAAIIFGGAALFSLDMAEGLTALATFLVVAVAFTRFYVPYRLKKLSD